LEGMEYNRMERAGYERVTEGREFHMPLPMTLAIGRQ